MSTKRIFGLFVIMLLFVSCLGSVQAAAPRGIEDRISSEIKFIESQFHTSSQVRGFLHSTAPGQSGRMYSEDASLVALALSAYQETHYSQEYYSYLKSSADFIVGAQTASGDFYEYFDLTNQSWNNGGRLYSWNPYAMMGPAYAAFVITSQTQAERTYWAGVIEMPSENALIPWSYRLRPMMERSYSLLQMGLPEQMLQRTRRSSLASPISPCSNITGETEVLQRNMP